MAAAGAGREQRRRSGINFNLARTRSLSLQVFNPLSTAQNVMHDNICRETSSLPWTHGVAPTINEHPSLSQFHKYFSSLVLSALFGIRMTIPSSRESRCLLYSFPEQQLLSRLLDTTWKFYGPILVRAWLYESSKVQFERINLRLNKRMPGAEGTCGPRHRVYINY